MAVFSISCKQVIHKYIAAKKILFVTIHQSEVHYTNIIHCDS